MTIMLYSREFNIWIRNLCDKENINIELKTTFSYKCNSQQNNKVITNDTYEDNMMTMDDILDSIIDDDGYSWDKQCDGKWICVENDRVSLSTPQTRYNNQHKKLKLLIEDYMPTIQRMKDEEYNELIDLKIVAKGNIKSIYRMFKVCPIIPDNEDDNDEYELVLDGKNIIGYVKNQKNNYDNPVYHSYHEYKLKEVYLDVTQPLPRFEMGQYIESEIMGDQLVFYMRKD